MREHNLSGIVIIGSQPTPRGAFPIATPGWRTSRSSGSRSSKSIPIRSASRPKKPYGVQLLPKGCLMARSSSPMAPVSSTLSPTRGVGSMRNASSTSSMPSPTSSAKPKPTPERKDELTKRFEEIFSTHTGYATHDRLLSRLKAQKSELLLVLERPDSP
jgi:hypothetical protein